MAPQKVNYRREIKLLVSQGEYAMLQSRLKGVLLPDAHAGLNGEYWIRSLYLDDQAQSAYWEKIFGTANRKKYRIRIYDGLDSVIKLECKEKRGSCIRKRSASISRETCERIIAGDFSPLSQYTDPLCQEVFALAGRNGLAPSVIVDYIREAYIHPVSNVRITFDKQLHAAVYSPNIFDPDMPTIPIYPDQSVILEVKYDQVFPRHISSILSHSRGTKMALSKFCLCRDAMRQIKPNY